MMPDFIKIYSKLSRSIQKIEVVRIEIIEEQCKSDSTHRRLASRDLRMFGSVDVLLKYHLFHLSSRSPSSDSTGR